MSLAIKIRLALGSERKLLEDLQVRASLANPGDRDALLANPGAIELPIQQIEAGCVFVAERDGVVAGFSAILPHGEVDSELDSLFVEPALQRLGVGRALVAHAAEFARLHGSVSLHVVGNPHAELFYLACGFRITGAAQTQFGRGLLMQLAL